MYETGINFARIQLQSIEVLVIHVIKLLFSMKVRNEHYVYNKYESSFCTVCGYGVLRLRMW